MYARRPVLLTPSLTISSALDNEPSALDQLHRDRAQIDGYFGECQAVGVRNSSAHVRLAQRLYRWLSGRTKVRLSTCTRMAGWNGRTSGVA
jgi:hypothetical protein